MTASDSRHRKTRISTRPFRRTAHPIRQMMAWLLVLLLASPSLLANRIHSYWRDDGVRVLTNRVPVRPERPGPRIPAGSESGLYRSTVREISRRYGVDTDLVNAVIRVESNFRPEAVSPKGCLGLMQLHPDTARRFGVRDAFDPVQNIEGGVRYLEFLLDYFQGDLELALAGYNAGENAVIRYGGVPPYPETIDYVNKVTSLYGFASARVPRDRIRRVVQPGGRILLTNIPSSHSF